MGLARPGLVRDTNCLAHFVQRPVDRNPPHVGLAFDAAGGKARTMCIGLDVRDIAERQLTLRRPVQMDDPQVERRRVGDGLPCAELCTMPVPSAKARPSPYK